MSFTLDMDAVLAKVTAIAGTVTGIRKAYDYDEWPEAPPVITKQNQAIHLTGFPGESDGGWSYETSGMGLAIARFTVPLYTVVSQAAERSRARQWAMPFLARYPEAFRDHVTLDATISGTAWFDDPTVVVSVIPDYEGYNGFYILRHLLTIVSKGAHQNASGA